MSHAAPFESDRVDKWLSVARMAAFERLGRRWNGALKDAASRDEG